jgi:hypothetical protein
MDRLIETISFKELSIQVDNDLNNNDYCGERARCDNSLLIARKPNKSVIVENHSVIQASKLPCRPIPVNQKNFFANNLSILFDFNNNYTSEPILTHPRIAFRRISAPSILSLPINNFKDVKFNECQAEVENSSGFNPKRRHSEPVNIRAKSKEGRFKLFSI